MQRQLEEMLAVAMMMMAVFMSAFVIYVMITFETEPMGTAIQTIALIALCLIAMGEAYHDYRLIQAMKNGDDEQ